MNQTEALSTALDTDDFVSQYELLTRATKDRDFAADADALFAQRFGETAPAPAINWQTVRARALRGQRARVVVERLAQVPSFRSLRRILTALAVLSSVAFALLLQDLWLLPQSESAQRGTAVMMVVAFSIALLSAMALASRWSWEAVGSVTGRVVDMGLSLATAAVVLIGIVIMVDRRIIVFGEAVSGGLTLNASIVTGEPYRVEVADELNSVRAHSSTPGVRLRLRITDDTGKLLHEGKWMAGESHVDLASEYLRDTGAKIEIFSNVPTKLTVDVNAGGTNRLERDARRAQVR